MNDDYMEYKDAQAAKKGDKDCPNCGGTMVFDPESGGLYCPYCDYREALPEERERSGEVTEQDFLSAENLESFSWGEDKKQVICSSCGAQIVYDALDSSAVCPFCGANHVMKPNDDKSIPPTGIIPFQVSEKQASEGFSRWLRHKLFAPRAAKKQASPEAFKGIYMPYWTYDAQTYSEYTARFGIDREYTDRNGNRRTETDWYHTSGDYMRFFDDELVFASTRHDASILRSIEPFYSDASHVKPYSPEYLSGFISERYSVGLKDGWNVARQQIENQLRSYISSDIRERNNADRVDSLRFTTEYSNITYKYILVPVWQSAFRYKDKVYQFMVNGQNGKVGGKTPVSALRVAIAILLGIAIVVLLIKMFG